MISPYVTWLLIFFILPMLMLWLFFWKNLWKYRTVFLKTTTLALMVGLVWEAYAIKFSIWGWSAACCNLPRVYSLPLEEVVWIICYAVYTTTLAIIVRDLLVKHRKLKKRA